MLKTALICLMALSLPGNALALSCMQPNMARSFNDKAADTQVWMLVEGKFVAELALSDLLRLPPPRPGEPVPQQESRTVTASAQFTGRQLGGTHSTPLETQVSLEVSCLTPWCGSFPPVGTSVLAFLAVGDGGNLTLRSGLCPGAFQAQPTPKQVATSGVIWA